MIAAGDDHRKRMMSDYPSSNYLFRGRVPGQLVSESVMDRVLKRCGYYKLTRRMGSGRHSRTGRVNLGRMMT